MDKSPMTSRRLLACILLACLVTYLYMDQPAVKINGYHKYFYEDPNTWNKNRWFGILTEQNPNDAWIIQEIITETKPDLIVEAGTFKGGSALLWATILQHVNPGGKVITIDIADMSAEAREFPLAKERVEFLIGSSTDSGIVNSIKERANGKRVLVILDSDHSKAHVLKELNSYWEIVSPGSYLVVQDTNVNGHPVLKDYGPGPMEAVEEFMARNHDFEIDQSRERLLFTTNPGGYLKRMK